jgi:SAM-dependent methyltransferase
VIKVLGNWQEVGEAILNLQREGLPLHESPQKNFDHFILRKALATVGKDAAIVDLGCGGAQTLRFLHALRFRNISGIDLAVEWRARGRQIKLMLRERTWRPPFRLRRGDLTGTLLPSASCDMAISISTIEHGVDIERFFAEAARILRTGGLLLVTTDYWENKIDTAGVRAFGLPWQIFSRDEIAALMKSAGHAGLTPVESGGVPACTDRPVLWQDRHYTFIAMLFKKCESPQ